MDHIKNLDKFFERRAVRTVSIAGEYRLKKCRNDTGSGSNDADLSIGKASIQQKKAGKTHDRGKIHPVLCLDTGVRSGEGFGFRRWHDEYSFLMII